MIKNKISVTKSSMPPFEEYCDEIKDLWESHWLTNSGVKHKELESRLREFLNVPCVSLYTNGHLALENAISAFKLSGEVITTPFTFASTTNAIVRNGLKPVFCDIKESDYTIDESKIVDLITEKTTAIIPVHVYGNVCNVEKIQNIAKQFNLKVIYDAAHAFAVEYKNMGIANYGDASMFSFHATKVFNTIEGGAVCYRDKNLYETFESQKNFGLRPNGDILVAGGNAKMNEFQAAMGLCNLRHVFEEIKKRESVYNRYVERLNGIYGIYLNLTERDVKSNYAYFPVRFSNYKYNRDKVFELLMENDIVARKYFSPATNEFYYINQAHLHNQETPVAKKVSNEILCLPMYADLSMEDVDRICDIILG